MESDQIPKRMRRSPPDLNLDPEEEEEGEGEEEDLPDSKWTRRSRRRKRQAPYIIFPEILCIVDYDGYRWAGPGKVFFLRHTRYFHIICSFQT